MNRRALVFGDDTRSFLTVVRSLGRNGLEVHAVPYIFDSPALRSKYIGRTYAPSPYGVSPEGWVSSVSDILRDETFDLVVPCDERSIIPLRLHREQWPRTKLAIANDLAFDTFVDKWKTRTAASAAGVPVARGRLLRTKDRAPSLISEFGLPIVLKPRQSYRLDNLAQRMSVRILATEEELDEAIFQIEEANFYVIEELVPGYGIGVSVIASNGQVGAVFQHERVHEPASGGGSSYRVSG